MPSPATALSLGIDIGGTFTDLVLHDPLGGRSGNLKVLTTPADPVQGILEGTRRLLAGHRVAPREVGRVVHATTLFTNALIERKGAVTALVTTEGFGDVLHIGRERRYELYDLRLTPPAPLVPAELRFEVQERVKASGEVLEPLDVQGLLARVADAVALGAESLAILFLHSDLHPAHEALAAARVAERFPQLSVTASYRPARRLTRT